MRKLVVSQSVTVDGAFDPRLFVPYQSDALFENWGETVFASDALLLGRTTYDELAASWSKQNNRMADRFNTMPKYVVSSTLLKAQWHNSSIIKENVVEEIGQLKQQPGQAILSIGSATLVQSLMQTDLIDEYLFFVFPTIAGTGKRFFKEGMGLTKLKLVENKTLSLGVVVLRYEPKREG